MNDWGAQDLQRRLANLIRVTTITELDDEAARARVTCAAVPDSAWLPILSARAGPDRSYWLPEPGEQVLLLSPSGDPAQGMILPAGYQDAHPPPADRRTVRRTTYADGTVVEYDREAHVLTVDCVGDVVVRAAGDLTADIKGKVVATAGGSVSWTSETSITMKSPDNVVDGPLTVTELLTYQGGMAGSGGSGATAKIDGAVEATGDVTGEGVSLAHHRNKGVQSGDDLSGEPE